MAAAEAALRLLGLAARGGRVISGTERVREAVRAGTVRLVLVAEDASPNTLDKLLPLLQARQVAHRVAFQRWELGAAVGRGPLSAVGVSDPALALRFEELAGIPPGGAGGEDTKRGERGSSTGRQER